MNSKIKKQLEYIHNMEENQSCFDCDKKPANWASVNNAIYLCLDCSGEHRGLGVGSSYIRSVVLDAWNEQQVMLLTCGGNKRLREFLQYFGVPRYMPKKQLYCSKLMNYYRKMIKAETTGEKFNEEVPGRDMLDSYTGESYSQSNTKQNFSSVSSDSSRFASIGSEPYKYSDDNLKTDKLSTIYGYLGSFLSKTKDVVVNVKDKVSEMELGSKIISAGGKTIEIIKYTGSVAIEKGTELTNSDSFHYIKSKAGDGLQFIKTKITGEKPNSDTYNINEGNDNEQYTQISDERGKIKESLLDRDDRY